MHPALRLRLARSSYESALVEVREQSSAFAWARLLRAARNLREAQRDHDAQRAHGERPREA